MLGELYYEALQAQGFPVSLNQNIGPTEVTLQALQSGQLAMYPEYLNTWNATIAGDQRNFKTRPRRVRRRRSVTRSPTGSSCSTRRRSATRTRSP